MRTAATTASSQKLLFINVYKDCDHDRSPQKTIRKTGFYEDGDHGRNLSKDTIYQCIPFINVYEDCDHDRSPQKTIRKTVFYEDSDRNPLKRHHLSVYIRTVTQSSQNN